jgi:hypothetical protein
MEIWMRQWRIRAERTCGRENPAKEQSPKIRQAIAEGKLVSWF